MTRYYYRKKREGRHVRSIYCGTGDQADLAELLDQVDRDQREEEKKAAREQYVQTSNIDRQTGEVEILIHAILHGSLLTVGYHTHRREWRRKQCQNR